MPDLSFERFIPRLLESLQPESAQRSWAVHPDLSYFLHFVEPGGKSAANAKKARRHSWPCRLRLTPQRFPPCAHCGGDSIEVPTYRGLVDKHRCFTCGEDTIIPAFYRELKDLDFQAASEEECLDELLSLEMVAERFQSAGLRGLRNISAALEDWEEAWWPCETIATPALPTDTHTPSR